MYPVWFERLASLRMVVMVFAAISAVHAGVVLMAGETLALDDDKINIFTQSLQLGYLPDNPPLFEWTLIAVQQLTGPVQLSFLLVKYFFLTLTALFTFLTAKSVYNNNSGAALATLPLLTIYQLGYNYHQAFTHSTVLLAAVAFFWFTLVRLENKRSTGDYILFGVAIGIGALSKYSFFPVVASAGLACLILRPWRSAVISPKILLSAVIAILVSLPHFVWVYDHSVDIAARAGERLETDGEPYWDRVATGIPSSLWAIGSFFLPFAAIAAFTIPTFGKAVFARGGNVALYRNATIIGGVSIVAAVLAFGVQSFAERYAIPFMYPAIFWLTGVMLSRAPRSRSVQQYILASLAFGGLFLVARIIQIAMPGPPFCSDCRQWVPYEALGEGLRSAGFDDGALVAFDTHTAGNLRRLFPKHRVMSAHLPFYSPPDGAPDAPCYFIWSTDLAPPPPPHIIPRFVENEIVTISAAWNHPYRGEAWRMTTWQAAPLNHDAGLMRSLCRQP